MMWGKYYKYLLGSSLLLLLPDWLLAQDSVAGDIKSLHAVLEQLYDEMIPLCSKLIGVARGLGGFAALWYIASRVWRHLNNAEPIDFYPLFKPFVIGFAIIIFPSTINIVNTVLKPLVTGTSSMVTESDAAIAALLKEKEDAIKETDVYKMYVGANGNGDYDKWYKYTHPDDQDGSESGWLDDIGNSISFEMAKVGYNFRNQIKELLSEVLQLLFAAASLCINTIRTFNLIILAILGPLAFAFSIFDGFSHSLRHWLARYINVYLWLPICNIFGAVIGNIQENMLKLDLFQISQQGDTFFSRTDMGYLIFLIIGIFGYFTVPSIANYIMFVGGGDALLNKSSAMVGAAMGGAAAGAAIAGGFAGSQLSQGLSETRGQLDKVSDAFHGLGMATMDGYNNGGNKGGSGYNSGRSVGRAGAYIYDKLSGKPPDSS